MRSFFLSALLALGFHSYAAGVSQAKDFRLTCTTSMAGLSLWADGDRFYLHFEDPVGDADFPIYSGNVSPSNVPEVQRAAKELIPFQKQIDMSWDLSKCVVDPARPFLISCSGMGEIAYPENSQFAVTGISTSTEYGQKIGISDYGMVNVTFFLVGKPDDTRTDVMPHYIKFPFDQNHCIVNKAKGEAL